jgi:hypothetical protein
MDKYLFDYTSPGFGAASSAHCSLNMLIGTEGFSWVAWGKHSAIQTLQRRHFAKPGRDFKEVETRIRTIFGSEPAFTYTYADVSCAFSNLNATLVPRRLFTADDLPAYFKLLLRPADYEYHYDPLPEFDCYLVYAVEPVVTRLCKQYFPALHISHLATSLLKTWQIATPADDYRVFLNTRNQQAQIAVFDRQNLLYYNAFQFENDSDLLYFVLLAYDQFRLSPEITPLTVSGTITQDTELYQLLYRYIRTIRDARLPGNTPLTAGTEGLPEHAFFDLFSLHPSPASTHP